MEQVSVWVRTGLVTAGVSAALLAGAGVAGASPSADPGAESGTTSSTSASTKDAPEKRSPAEASAVEQKDDEKKDDLRRLFSYRPRLTPREDKREDMRDDKQATKSADARPLNRAKSRVEARKTKILAAVEAAASTETKEPEKQLADSEPVFKDSFVKDLVKDVVDDLVAKTEPSQFISTTTSLSSLPIAQRSTTSNAAPPSPLAVLAAIGSVVGAVITNVGSASLVALQAVEAAVTGPPVLPPGSTVTVKSSTITLNTGQVVPADWYYPEVEEGEPAPTRMILLSHGLLALGPMYSYTAANLAEATNSIVVAPSIPSNFFAGDDHWLGGTGMAKSVADLFVGNREALTQSALDAGYAEQYGLDPATARLPQKFALVGHSLGGSLVMGAAGFLAENGAAKDLVGVITLDGVPTGTTASDALRKLAKYDADNVGDQYVPIREIGAPLNLFNFPSNINEALTTSRPDRFNGVVLDGGVHMDSMRGGNPLIQLAAYVVAGFPQPQNPPAVDSLSAEWLDQWFDGQKYVGDGLAPGSTIDVETPQGTAHGVVLGKPAAFPLPLSAPTAIPAVNPVLARLAA